MFIRTMSGVFESFWLSQWATQVPKVFWSGTRECGKGLELR